MSTERELLIGIAVDVSYSMKSSIRNDANEQYSRFDSFRIALKKLAEEAKRTINQNAEDSITSRVNTFIYVYGLQNAENSDLIIDSGVCDYLSLIQVAKTLKNTGNTDIKKTQEYEDLRKIAYQYDLGKVLDDEVLNAMKVNKKATRNMIRRLEIDRDSRVELSEYIKKAYGAKETAETIGTAGVGGGAILGGIIGFLLGGPPGAVLGVGIGSGSAAAGAGMVAWDAKTKKEEALKLVKKLSQPLDTSEEFEFGLEDTTLPLNEVLELVNDEAQTEKIEDFIYGNTPMKEAFFQINRRVVREEREKRNSIVDRILFVISDGESTDGDPSSYAGTLREKGVTIISCYITDKDIMNPRVLPDKIDNNWADGAKLMYGISSPIDLSSRFVGFLSEKGWALTEHSKYFVQLNHSDVLEEFIKVVLSPLKDTQYVWPRGT